jgi:4-amino-4-deoxy-L-arabinose transferase-like glycosyltransferase
VLKSRLSALLRHPGVGVLLVYLFGVAWRVDYSLHLHPPEKFIASDMQLYVDLAFRLLRTNEPLQPWDVTHPLGYPTLLSWFVKGSGSLAGAVTFQIFISCLVPLAVGLLGAVTYGRRTALAAIAFASVYFPFVEYGALFLSEIHFILWLTLAFAGFFAALGARRRLVSVALAAGGGLCLSIAIAMKSVALLGAVAFFAADGLALVLARPAGGRTLWARLSPWVMRGAAAAVAAFPLLALLARTCTRANHGRFCVTGNKVGSDFLLGHYGRIADIEWGPEDGHSFKFGSLGSHLRHYESHVHVPFPMTDNAANKAEAWRWIFAHPGDAIVLSLDHIYDTFFGPVMWPSYGDFSWRYAQLAQWGFIAFLFIPTVLACARIIPRGARAFLTSRTALLLAPIASIAVTVAIATGEIRYRIPFDIFFICIACALAVGDLKRVDGGAAPAPREAPAT